MLHSGICLLPEDQGYTLSCEASLATECAMWACLQPTDVDDAPRRKRRSFHDLWKTHSANSFQTSSVENLTWDRV